MNFIRKAYIWFYVFFKGHYPPGTLVRFSPDFDRGISIIRDPNYDPNYDAIGVSIGGWTQHTQWGKKSGTTVIIAEKQYDLYNYAIEVIDEQR